MSWVLFSFYKFYDNTTDSNIFDVFPSFAIILFVLNCFFWPVDGPGCGRGQVQVILSNIL